jgi:hypothetical protein
MRYYQCRSSGTDLLSPSSKVHVYSHVSVGGIHEDVPISPWWIQLFSGWMEHL